MSAKKKVPEITQEYCFLPEDGISAVAEMDSRKKTVRLSIAFCQENVAFDREYARRVLNLRLQTALRPVKLQADAENNGSGKLIEGFAVSPYVKTVKYSGKTPRTDVLLPFLMWVRGHALAEGKRNVRHVLKKVRLCTFELGEPVPMLGLSLSDAQSQSIVGAAIRRSPAHGSIVWPKNSDFAFSWSQFGFVEMSEAASERLAKYEDWHPMAPLSTKNTSKFEFPDDSIDSDSRLPALIGRQIQVKSPPEKLPAQISLGHFDEIDLDEVDSESRVWRSPVLPVRELAAPAAEGG